MIGLRPLLVNLKIFKVKYLYAFFLALKSRSVYHFAHAGQDQTCFSQRPPCFFSLFPAFLSSTD